MSLCRALHCLKPLHARLLVVRCASAAASGGSKVHLEKPEGESGYFQYDRNYSRDPKSSRPKPQQGDTPFSFMFRRLGHAYEVYPLIFLGGFWLVIFIATAYYSFTKIEIWLDRSKSAAPWDWERSRDSYYKQGTVAFDLEGRTRKRCELMEILQDEMLEAAKRRGTR
ncbi:hypothetical protein ANCCAN_22091 [Ancylostoma caninum]|uniref:Uncharacterized protein n=1 Tax=Ancylostoma caninum TaxID=29170 RepID=A0A368FMT7_ANCCA|nr:hypothetical protein ANCCAN_28096 [Ancylostoma caninum]RCN32115.1 hypothetical protein ANCCAN_22091 [Ancylostoma caninum]